MKATIKQKDLQQVLSSVMAAVAKKPQTPILSCILLSPKVNALELYANNFQTAMSVIIPANCDDTQLCAIPGVKFFEIVRNLSGEIVILESAGNSLVIKSDAAKFTLRTQNPEDFPLFGVVDTDCYFSIQESLLRDLILKTSFAVKSKETLNPVFKGINFKLKGDTLTATATNARQVAVSSAPVIESSGDANFTAPLNILHLPKSPSRDPVVDVRLSRAAAEFDNGYCSFATRLIDGAFPQADKIFEGRADSSLQASIDVKELHECLRRIEIIAKDSLYNSVKFNFTEEGLEISAADQSGCRVVEHVDADCNGSFAANYNFNNFADLLTTAKFNGMERLAFAFGKPLAPIFASYGNFDYATTPLRD